MLFLQIYDSIFAIKNQQEFLIIIRSVMQMGFFKGIFKSRDKPKNRTAGSAFSFFLGNSTSGKRVNERSAMQMTAVYACVRILSEAIAGLPLHLYRYNDTGGKEKAIDNSLYFLLHDEPNPEMTSFAFRETLMTHLLLWGNAYAQIIRNGRGEVLGLYPLMPDRMTVDRDEKGQLYYEYMVRSDDAPINKDSTVKLKPHEVLHIPGLGFDGLVGYSPIAMAKNAIGRIQNCRVYKGFNDSNRVMFDFGICTKFGGVFGANISSGYNNISIKFANEGHKNNTAIYGHSNIDITVNA